MPSLLEVVCPIGFVLFHVLFCDAKDIKKYIRVLDIHVGSLIFAIVDHIHPKSCVFSTGPLREDRKHEDLFENPSKSASNIFD